MIENFYWYLNAPSFITDTDTLAVTGRTKSCGHLGITWSPAEKFPSQVMERVGLILTSFVDLYMLCCTNDLFLYVRLLLPELFSVSKDKAVHIMDVVVGKLVTRIPKAHRYCLICWVHKFQLLWVIYMLTC